MPRNLNSARKASSYLARFSQRVRQHKDRNEHPNITDIDAVNLGICARAFAMLIGIIERQETELMNVANLAKVATDNYTKAQAEIDTLKKSQPPADRVLNDADVAGLQALAAANGVDTDGNPVAPAAPAAPAQ